MGSWSFGRDLGFVGWTTACGLGSFVFGVFGVGLDRGWFGFVPARSMDDGAGLVLNEVSSIGISFPSTSYHRVMKRGRRTTSSRYIPQSLQAVRLHD